MRNGTFICRKTFKFWKIDVSGERYKSLKEHSFIFDEKNNDFKVIDIENYSGKKFNLIAIAFKFYKLDELIKDIKIRQSLFHF